MRNNQVTQTANYSNLPAVVSVKHKACGLLTGREWKGILLQPPEVFFYARDKHGGEMTKREAYASARRGSTTAKVLNFTVEEFVIKPMLAAVETMNPKETEELELALSKAAGGKEGVKRDSRGDVVLVHHLGLGDCFICNGLVHNFAKVYNGIYLPCHKRNITTVRSLYSEYPNIIAIECDDKVEELREQARLFAKEKNLPITWIGFEDVYFRERQLQDCGKMPVAVNFDRQFYELA
ncbi:MAG: hypothetical protein AAB649_07660, partial [Patescibacteria group bacterium]